jgi:hypothetical protein
MNERRKLVRLKSGANVRLWVCIDVFGTRRDHDGAQDLLGEID